MRVKPNFYTYPGLKTHAQIQIRRKVRWGMKELTADEILGIVSDVFDVSQEDILSPSRVHIIHRARTAAQALMRHFTMLTFNEIAKAVGRGHHATAIHNINQSTNWIVSYDEYRKYYQKAFDYCTLIKQQSYEQTS